MKALFVRCYGRLTADMMIGGLIDMGVPPVYLKSCLSDAGITADFMEKPNPAAQISAHYFHIFPEAFEGPLYMVSFMARWRSLCKRCIRNGRKRAGRYSALSHPAFLKERTISL